MQTSGAPLAGARAVARDVIESVPSPLGLLRFVVTSRGLAFLTMRPEVTDPAIAHGLAKRGLAAEAADAGIADQVSAQLKAYFEGHRRCFEVPLDLRGLPHFSTRALRELVSIPFGTTVTYGEVARRLGKPGAARAVGQVNGRNPVAIIVPCHRVIAAGGIGGYTGGLHLKRWLLAHEGRAGQR